MYIAICQNKGAGVIENQNVADWRDDSSGESFLCKREDVSSNS